MPSEFDLIQQFFTRQDFSSQDFSSQAAFSSSSTGVVLGVGDDAALLKPAAGKLLAVSSDMLVAGRHFLADDDPYALGHKTLAVNLSDMAAMGATPRWATLALALPSADSDWLSAFSQGFFALADRFEVVLVGGDTTRGPLNLCVTIFGETLLPPYGQALRRDQAQIDDEIWVSGALGGAALGLAHRLGEIQLNPTDAQRCLARLHRPEPRVALGLALAQLPDLQPLTPLPGSIPTPLGSSAVAAIDISDGLLADLGHILERSQVGADIELARIPTQALTEASLPLQCLLAGGDDYELCFTTAKHNAAAVRAAGEAAGVAVTRIGVISAQPGLRVRGPDGLPLSIHAKGFDHFV